MTARLPDPRDEGGDPVCWAHLFEDADAGSDPAVDDDADGPTLAASQSSSTMDPKPRPQ